MSPACAADRLVQRAAVSACRARSAFLPPRLRSRCSASAALEPGAVDAHAVLGGELDRQVDREAVGVVEAERDLTRQHRRIGGQILGPTADDALGARSAG